MAKLYPPYIEGTIPAFFEDDDGTVVLTVPLSMNKAVGQSDIKKFIMKIKTAQTGLLLDTISSQRFDITTDMTVWFDLRDIKEKLIVGQYYKIQIAYVDSSDQTGYYSTVGVTKYTTKPDIAIDGLNFGKINSHQYKYIGTYNQKNKDITERVYSYCFDIYDADKNIIATSGDLIHNRNNDVNNYESQDEWFYENDLKENETYYIRYIVKTLNNLIVSSASYRIMQKKTIDPDANLKLIALPNFDNGYIDVLLEGSINEETGAEIPITGSFLVCRASKDEDNFNWLEVFRFNLNASSPSRQLWRDFTVEQGKTYIYSLQQYNDYGLYSNRLLSNEVYADFEDSFLFDGERQLKIRYNPKVSSFKNTIYETKIDTIGGKHPFIFRNAVTNYKEFPISGLISYFMDEDELFISTDKYGLIEKTTNLVGENVAAEREFKLEVLNWLNDGKTKLFRSPTEGNYLVRLLNVSMTPTDGLGRMLHTFNATAYEIADYNFKNLAEYNIIEVKEPKIENLLWRTIKFFEEQEDGSVKFVPHGNPFLPLETKENSQVVYIDGEKFIVDTSKNLLRLSNGSSLVAREVIFKDMTPGTEVLIVRSNKYHTVPEAQFFVIGATGAYQIDEDVGISGIYLTEEDLEKKMYLYEGSVSVSYYSRYNNIFNLYAMIDTGEVPIRQFVGLQKEEGYIYNDIQDMYIQAKPKNIIELIEDVKTELIRFYQLDFVKRPIEYIYKGEDKNYYKVPKGQQTEEFKIDLEKDLDSYYLYKVYHGDNTPQNNPDSFLTYLDGYDKKEYYKNLYNTKIYINDNTEIDINETENFHLENFEEINKICFGLGIILTAAYQTRTYIYNLEIDPYIPLSNPELLKKLQDTGKELQGYENELEELTQQLENKEITLQEFIEKEKPIKTNIESTNKAYLKLLEETIKIYKEDNEL